MSIRARVGHVDIDTNIDMSAGRARHTSCVMLGARALRHRAQHVRIVAHRRLPLSRLTLSTLSTVFCVLHTVHVVHAHVLHAVHVFHAHV